ncbi:MAG: hypothetical protein KTR25_16470 [Myxococcales bacterium]|nr:hypothetical protein [Myxococcales bacterium]
MTSKEAGNAKSALSCGLHDASHITSLLSILFRRLVRQCDQAQEDIDFILLSNRSPNDHLTDQRVALTSQDAEHYIQTLQQTEHKLCETMAFINELQTMAIATERCLLPSDSSKLQIWKELILSYNNIHQQLHPTTQGVLSSSQSTNVTAETPLPHSPPPREDS